MVSEKNTVIIGGIMLFTIVKLWALKRKFIFYKKIK